jgi:hypothetical protein
MKSGAAAQGGHVGAVHTVGKGQQLALAFQGEFTVFAEKFLRDAFVLLRLQAAGAVNQPAPRLVLGGGLLEQRPLLPAQPRLWRSQASLPRCLPPSISGKGPPENVLPIRPGPLRLKAMEQLGFFKPSEIPL